MQLVVATTLAAVAVIGQLEIPDDLVHFGIGGGAFTALVWLFALLFHRADKAMEARLADVKVARDEERRECDEKIEELNRSLTSLSHVVIRLVELIPHDRLPPDLWLAAHRVKADLISKENGATR